jgi:glycogen(starch) synthase
VSTPGGTHGLRTSEQGGEFDSDIYVSGYERHFRPDDPVNPFQGLYERKRRAVLAFFDRFEPMKVVDVGGGPGRLTAPLAERHELTHTDISEEMIEEARRRSPAGTRFVQADARELPFEEGEFDGLLALDLLCHLPDLEAGIRELARVVRPGGALVFDTTNALPLWVLAYPKYVGPHPRRLVRTLALRGVLPEWRRTVRHDRASAVRQAIGAVGLDLEDMQRFGRAGLAKWHLWYAAKPAT